MSTFQDGYGRMVDNIGGVAGTSGGSHYANQVQDAVDNAIEAIRREATHRANVPEDYLKGWLAEQWHAETLKVSAAARGRSDVWAYVPANNSPGEDIHYGDSNMSRHAEVKYYKDGGSTAKAISKPEYAGTDKVVPADQLEGVKAQAGKLAQKNQAARPDQATHYEDTAQGASDHLEVGNASSKGLSEKDAKGIAKGYKRDGDIDADKYGLNTQSFVEWSDVAREAGEAALHAAILSAALRAAPHIWSITSEYLRTGQIDPDDILSRGNQVLLTGTAAGLRGGTAAALTAACRTGLLGTSLKSVSPPVIGIATTMTLNVVGYSLQLQQGRISNGEFAINCARDTFVLCTGMLGATIGQVVLPIPALGALAGNLVGSTVGAVFFEGTNQFVVAVCREHDWTFFRIVDHDYTVPEEVLLRSGYDLFSAKSFPVKSFSTGGFGLRSFETSSLSFQPLRRGAISCCAIAYL